MFDQSKICNDVLVETYVNKYDLESSDGLEVMNFKKARQVVAQTLRQSSPQSIAKYLKCSTDNVKFNHFLIKNGIHPEQELLEGMHNFFSFVYKYCNAELGGYGDWIRANTIGRPEETFIGLPPDVCAMIDALLLIDDERTSHKEIIVDLIIQAVKENESKIFSAMSKKAVLHV